MKKFFACFILISSSYIGFAQNSFTELVQRTEGAVVTVNTYSDDGDLLKIGTAFFIDSSGVLISNYHVFENSINVKIVCQNKENYDVERILSYDLGLDLIKFKIVNPTNKRFPIIEKAAIPPAKGEDVFVIGSPAGFESSVSRGIVSGIREVTNWGKLYQITAPISFGSSGSPVLNMEGKVIGIASLQYQEGQNLNFAIDIKLIDQLKEQVSIAESIKNEYDWPKDKDAIRKLFDSPLYTCDLEGLKLASKYITEFPNDYFGYFIRAQIYSCWSLADKFDSTVNFEQKRIEFLIAADKDFSRALLLSSNKGIVYWYRGVAKYVNLMNEQYSSPKLVGWDYKGTIADFNNCIGLEKKVDLIFDKSRFEYIGNLKKSMNDFKGAVTAYNQAIKMYPERPKIYQLYGNCANIYYYELDDLKKASEYIDSAFKLIDSSGDLTNSGNLDADLYNTFIDWDLFSLYASIQCDLGNFSSALVAINTLLGCGNCVDAYYAYNHYLKAYIVFKIQGDLNEVISELNQALAYENDEKNKVSYYHLRSKSYFLNNQYSLSLIDINRCFELTPTSKISSKDYRFRANIKKAMEDLIGALKDINEAIQLDCNSADNYYYKGTILMSMSDNYGAIQAFDKAIQINPQETSYYIQRGFAKYDNNKIGACADWSKAGEIGDYSAYDLISKYCK